MNILQIGCNIGNDHVSDFLKLNKKHLNKVLLVDASSSALDLAEEFYKDFTNIKFQNFAIVDTEENEIDFFYPEDSHHSSHSSVLESFVKTHKDVEGRMANKTPVKIKKKKVPALRINSLLDYFDEEPIDRLYIDVEGLDCRIVNDIDYRKYNIQYIRFEAAHSEGVFSGGGEELTKTCDNLTFYGYQIIKAANDNRDLVAIKNF